MTFRWSGAVQSVCPFCRSILVRTDVAIQDVGKVGDLPPDSSPIQLMTSGRFNNKNFDVTGRLIYQYENGYWNEWHIVFSDGASAWLSDAQLTYEISWRVPNGMIPPLKQVHRGLELKFQNIQFEVATMTIASYKGMEGELPFPFYGKTNMLFADLRSRGDDFATLDYSDESEPMLFVGKNVTYDSLQLKNVRQFEGWS